MTGALRVPLLLVNNPYRTFSSNPRSTPFWVKQRAARAGGDRVGAKGVTQEEVIRSQVEQVAQVP